MSGPRTKPAGARKGASDVSEVQDPKIAGDSGAEKKRIETADVAVDEAGQTTVKKTGVDLLH